MKTPPPSRFSGRCRRLCCNTLMALAALTLPTGCTRRIYIPVENERVVTVRDTLRLSAYRIDSVATLDSVIIERRGDTVYNTSYRIRYRQRLLHDTVYRVRTHTVAVHTATPVPVSATEPLWRSLTPYLIAGGIFLVIAAIMRIRRS